ncbi:hypothetical protein AQ490_01305 [Wenjunlia vitaminophila]|uniref:EcsC family protein n=1 Tax=Wenjunlia vitaminophila TaxID=76728 RepID=A0A0T6LZ74_WENVI|nr:hypothetical protein [Wenjunlia vitaminophila]KRV51422.1 hypothetical protein AQ490_01305 [Wenjunlia vitaminophila]
MVDEDRVDQQRTTGDGAAVLPAGAAVPRQGASPTDQQADVNSERGRRTASLAVRRVGRAGLSRIRAGRNRTGQAGADGGAVLDGPAEHDWAVLAGGGVPAAPETSTGRKVSLAALTERLLQAAPRIPVRDLATLRERFPGLDAEQLADRLVTAAARGTATVGAGVGAAASLPVPPAMTVELATETLGVAAVEIRLIAELHEVYGLRPPGTTTQRAYAYVGAWANRRGVDVLKQGSIAAALSAQLKRELRQRLFKRTLRNLPTLAPFLIGAAIGGVVNRRDTRRLAAEIRADLRSRAVPWDQLAPANSPWPGREELPG